MKRTLLFSLLVLILFSLYWYGATQQLRNVNTDMTSGDQSAYMDYTRKLVESNYTYPGGGNRMPLYPMLQSLFHGAEENDQSSFTRGKYVNLILSIILLIAIFLIIRSKLKWHMTVNFILITAFTVFMFKAPYYQAELLSYFLTFVLFLSMLRLFRHSSILLALFTGILAGLVYLTKASVLPGLLLFLAFIGIRSLLEFNRQRHSMPAKQAFVAARHILLVAPIVSIFFLITIFPQIRNNRRIFGRYFYNVNSTFYMWYDSWEEAKQGTRAHGDRVGWPDMAPEDIPSLEQYLRDHTPTQILDRFWSGTVTTFKIMFQSYGYFTYVFIYFALLLFVSIWQWSHTKQLIQASPIIVLFALSYFIGYFLLYAWYVPIASGNRFVLALLMPFLFVLLRSLQAYDIPRVHISSLGRVEWLGVVNLLLLALLTLDIYLILSRDIATVYGGN